MTTLEIEFAPAERSEELTGTRFPAPIPDCPRCDGSGSYRDSDGLREWTEECPCLYGPAPEREEIPL